MAWYLRAVQIDEHLWVCRKGLTEYDVHDGLLAATTHLREIANELGSCELFAHPMGHPAYRIDPLP